MDFLLRRPCNLLTHTGKAPVGMETLAITISPELQPVERVWPLVDAVVGAGVDSERELWEKVESRCAYLRGQPDLIRSYTQFHWWPGGCKKMGVEGVLIRCRRDRYPRSPTQVESADRLQRVYSRSRHG